MKNIQENLHLKVMQEHIATHYYASSDKREVTQKIVYEFNENGYATVGTEYKWNETLDDWELIGRIQYSYLE